MNFATVMDRLKQFPAGGIFQVPEGTMRDIYDCIIKNRLTSCLELGSGHGATSCVIGAAVQETGGKATTIDIRRHEPAHAQALKDHVGLGPELEVIVDPLGYNWWLAEVLRRQPVKSVYQPVYDFIFLDGACDWQLDALAAFMAIGLLKPGGWLVLDDINFNPRSVPDWQTRFGHLSERELDACQMGLVWNLVVRQQPSMKGFRVTEGGRVGWAMKRHVGSPLAKFFLRSPQIAKV